MNTTRNVPRLVVPVIVPIVLAGMFTRPAEAIPPQSGPMHENPTVPAQPNHDRGDGHGDSFDWQGFVGGLMRGTQERPTRRPGYPERWQPDDYPRPLRPRQPTYPPDDYVQPVAPPTVMLTPNVVKLQVQVPKQPSPLEGRVSELSTREAQIYAKELADFINVRLAAAIDALQTGGVEITVMQKQADSVRQMMTSGSRWRDMEQVLKALLEGDTSKYPPETIKELQRIAELIAVRDAFLVVAGAPPRARRGPLPVAAIPVGLVWILFDPSLAAGTALLVNDMILVVGTGGHGQFAVVQECAAAALGLPVAPGDPVPDIGEAETAALKDAIIIGHRTDAASEVHYILNGRFPFAIQPGHKQKLPANRSWSIEFDRGNSQGTARYALERGVYEFRVVSGRWDLVRLQFDVTIDNRQGTQDFQYVAGDQVVTVKAGETQTHSSAEPVIVKFDRGEGPEHAATKNLNKSGTYKVAINTQTNLLDLYAMAEPDTQQFPIP